jgi:protocatechuate 3,4-dioxygenase beta subunit
MNSEDNGTTRGRLTRRQALAATGAGALGLGAGLYFLLRGDGDAPEPSGSPGPGGSRRDAPGAGAPGEDMCVLTPEQTEGPFYVDDSMVRRDVTEAREGVALELRLSIRDATECEPIRDATVEIWHCDAMGAYSGFDAQGTFLRGAQRSDRDGQVSFRTIYPGWYQGRATHIHVKVHVAGDEVHTGQLYFDEAVTRTVYGRAPYDSRGEPTTTNASDGLYAAGGEQSTLALLRQGDGYVGRMTLGVRS